MRRHFNRLLNSDMVAGRWMLGFGALLWGIFLLWPGELFPTDAQIAAHTGRTTYAIMAQIAPEWLWALAFTVHGAFLLLSIFVRVPPSAALIDAFNGAVLWLVATISCYAAHFNGWATYQPPAAMGADAAMAVGSLWWLIRVWADKDYEAKH
jgi:hypothetical protein